MDWMSFHLVLCRLDTENAVQLQINETIRILHMHFVDIETVRAARLLFDGIERTEPADDLHADFLA